jgi:hypothetical protein
LTVILVAGVTLYSLAVWVAYMLMAIEVRWTAVMWSVVSGAGVRLFFDFPAAVLISGRSANVSSAPKIGRNLMSAILKRGISAHKLKSYTLRASQAAYDAGQNPVGQRKPRLSH